MNPYMMPSMSEVAADSANDLELSVPRLIHINMIGENHKIPTRMVYLTTLS